MHGKHSLQVDRDAARREELMREAGARYWKRSVRLIVALLVVWFSASFGCAILFRDALDEYMLPGTGFPLGFWFAQQGAIVVFVLLVGLYVLLASRLDADLEAERNQIDIEEPAPAAPSTDAHGEAGR